jgi:hypothetical protein
MPTRSASSANARDGSQLSPCAVATSGSCLGATQRRRSEDAPQDLRPVPIDVATNHKSRFEPPLVMKGERCPVRRSEGGDA